MDDPARRYTVDLLKSPLMAFAASVTDPHQFRSGRQFAAWLGLTPLQHSSGGKERLGRISKMGDKYLRRLLVVGMTSLVRRAKYKPDAVDARLAHLLSRKPTGAPTLGSKASSPLPIDALVMFPQDGTE
jgi:transposase